MKKLNFIIVVLLLFFACDNNNKKAEVIETGDPINPPVETIDQTTQQNDDQNNNNDDQQQELKTKSIQSTLYTSLSLKFYDGEKIFEFYSGKTAQAASGIYSAGNILYYLDEYSNIYTSYNLITIPDFIRVDELNFWIVEKISPDDAYGMGALPKPYTKIYKNENEYGHWYDRQFECNSIALVGTDIYVSGTTGGWRHINGSYQNVNHAQDNFVVYDLNTDTRTAKINGISVSWLANFFNSAKFWQKSGSVWYSHNGYSFDGTILIEDDLVMANIRSIQNVIITAGKRTENSEEVLYWINCATGWVIRHVPSLNQSTEFIRLFTGDGELTTGIYYKQLLKPCLTKNKLYFIFDAQIYVYDFTTGLTSHFTNGISEVWAF